MSLHHLFIARPAPGVHPARRSLAVRPARPQDHEALHHLYAELGAGSLRRRFHVAMRRVSAQQVDQLLRIGLGQPGRAQAVVAEAPGGRVGQLLGHALWHRDGPHSGEFALVVADAHQGRGIGTALMQGLARQAAWQGLKYLHASVLHDNRPMLQLAHTLGACIDDMPDEPGLQRIAWPMAPASRCAQLIRWLSAGEANAVPLLGRAA